MGFIALLAFGCTHLVTALMRLGAPRWGLLDRPEGRKRHARARPVLGAALALGSLSAWAGWGPGAPSWGWTLGGLALLALGLDDDLSPRSPWRKLAGQLLIAAGVVAAGGGRFQALALGGWHLGLGWLGGPLTVLWLVTATNAFNLIDGSDGLTVGIGSLVAVGLLGLFPLAPALRPLAWALLGSGLAFWLWNRPPARAFLGDGGSYFWGFSLGWLALQLDSTLEPLRLLGLFLVPLSDTAYAILRRGRAGRSPFSADHEHIHHRLERRWGAWGMLLFLYGLSLVGIGLAAGWSWWWR